jgi:hypothetical protein
VGKHHATFVEDCRGVYAPPYASGIAMDFANSRGKTMRVTVRRIVHVRALRSTFLLWNKGIIEIQVGREKKLPGYSHILKKCETMVASKP